MAKYAIPAIVSSIDEITSKTAIPLCGGVVIIDPSTDDYVKCPIVDSDLVSLGCCIDTQKVAKSYDFEGHELYEIFENGFEITKKEPLELRKICLVHQLEILDKQLAEMEDVKKSGVQQLYTEVKAVLDKL